MIDVTFNALKLAVYNIFNNDIITEENNGFWIEEKRLCISKYLLDNNTLTALYERDYRVINPSGNTFETIRNDILYQLNELQVLNVAGGAPILKPRLSGDAGWDIVVQDNITCLPGIGTDIASNLYMALPNHLYAVVQARSSTSKKKILVLPGVIDPGYRGQIFVMAYNLSDHPIVINKGDRIAQLLIFQRVSNLELSFVSDLRPSERGVSGFGSTGT